MMQKDLVLSINEYAYVLDRTKGNVLCHVGPTKTSLSQSDELVRFEPKSKKFRPCGYNEAISLFASAPENWYLVLKNPTKSGRRPTAGTSNNLPEDIEIGRKINIPGPVSFALYPGQMAKVVKGHALRTNQYLLARVYDAARASVEGGQVIDADGNVVVPEKKDYVNGQILVIKGTDISFYIPPTGIEVIPLQNNDALGYIRDAVTLERLEYCILKDEDGNKRYVHGPEVVFPEPTESFVTSPKGGFIFRAIELSKISGIYVKVIAEYADDDGTVHPVGEELFITGDNQMIYYPRPEHAIINYDEKILHHAIAIPDGEGIYVMNRMNGEIKTVRGPAMYLPDPRVEVVVKRKLSQRECNLWYPGNQTALAYNAGLTEKSLEKAIAKSVKAATANLDSSTATAYSVTNSVNNINRSTLANLICRFFDVQSGSVRVGEADVRDIPKEELMDTISFVFQNSRLLKGSILDNVRLGRAQATEAEVLAALKAAQCMDIVEKFPEGIHTVIGTKGVYLSGGEQQRIAIARAMLKNAPILLLDEATAFADPDNEARVQAAFAQLAKGKTVIMIAHRLSTVANADCIYVVQDGQIAESGTKDELCAQNGLFARMWQDYQASVQWKVAKEG